MPESVSVPTPMLESDLATAAAFMYASQLQQATNRFVFLNWPNESGQLALYNASMQLTFRDPTQEMYKVTDASGEMIASLILARKTPVPAEIPAAAGAPQRPFSLEAMNPDVRRVMGRALVGVQGSIAGVDHLVLSTIFVQPDARCKGVGTQLVKFSLERAAAQGLPLFLSSVPSAAGFYRKLGFRNTDHVDIDLSQWTPEHGGFGIYRLQGMVSP
ncbi:hypothetical protein BX600DRAFT_252515 [Xylariales sp. PMI_506]|nr:hypothetical protein BX600DRAFT_252515 [Xylariales sp. PMI_506]